MSFGYSVGDFIAVGTLAWRVYKSCKDASKSFANISSEVLSLHAVLKEVEEILSNHSLPASRTAHLETITSGCHGVLIDLEALVEKYKSLGTQTRRTWDRLRWHADEVAELRARLTSNTVMLTAFISTSQILVQQKLDEYLQEFRDGKHETSIVSTHTIESLSEEDEETWRQIRKDLEDIGISVAAYYENRDFIMAWFKSAIENRAFDEYIPVIESSEATGGKHILAALESNSNTHTTTDSNALIQRDGNSRLKSPSTQIPVESMFPSKIYKAQCNAQLVLACINRHTATSIELLKGRADPNTEDEFGIPCLTIAVAKDSLKLVQILLTYGADVKKQTRSGVKLENPILQGIRPRTLDGTLGRITPLYTAISFGRTEIAKELLSFGATIHEPGLLELAIKVRGAETLEFLLANGADVQEKYAYDMTPLHCTMIPQDHSLGFPETKGGLRDRVKKVKVLLAYGAEVDAETVQGKTPLNIALQSPEKATKQIDIIVALLEKGACVSDNAALSILFKDSAIIDCLLQKNAIIDCLLQKHREELTKETQTEGQMSLTHGEYGLAL